MGCITAARLPAGIWDGGPTEFDDRVASREGSGGASGFNLGTFSFDGEMSSDAPCLVREGCQGHSRPDCSN